MILQQFLGHPLLSSDTLLHGFGKSLSSQDYFAHDDPAELDRAKRQDLEASVRLALCEADGKADAVLTVRQTHSPHILEIHREDCVVPPAEIVHCDALISDRPGLLIGVKTADCLPILLAAPERGVVAAVHAGWRGTYRGILHHTILRMESQFGCSPDSLRLVFGPCARMCCYEVDHDLGEAFATRFGAKVRREGQPRPFLDLVAANHRQAEDLGVPPAQIGDMGYCTMCSTEPRFYSWRRDAGRTGRLLNLIGLARQPKEE